jgi:hypothetical protein
MNFIEKKIENLIGMSGLKLLSKNGKQQMSDETEVDKLCVGTATILCHICDAELPVNVFLWLEDDEANVDFMKLLTYADPSELWSHFWTEHGEN